MTILGLIPARGGSKGIPRKNLRLVGSKPLIAWTIEAARQSRVLELSILSARGVAQKEIECMENDQ